MSKVDLTKKQNAPAQTAATSLRLDWCTYEAAKYAVEHWHYSKTMPRGKNVYIGVWEDGQFIGAVVFGTGAGRVTDGKCYGLGFMQMAELVRIALRQHKTQVSRIIKISLKMLRANSPGLRLVVSFADPFNGHHGGIYQAGGWIYNGTTASARMYQLGDRIIHPRSLDGGKWMGAAKPVPVGAKPLVVPGKHRYLYPLDAAMRKQIAPLAKPYPKRATSIDSDAAGLQSADGGASPTVALQTTNE